MKQLLSILAICLVTTVVKSQNIFPTAVGSNVGIGNITPPSKLLIANDAPDQQVLIVQGANAQTGNLQEWKTNNGIVRSSISADGTEFTVGVPGAYGGGGEVGTLVIGGQGKLKFYNKYSTTYLFESYGIHVTGDADRPLNVDGGSLVVGYASDGTRYGTNNALVAGSVGIGTTNISDVNYKLFVETGIRTRKIKVDAFTWSDYVFEKNYKLPILRDVEKFIQLNKHLPGVPSASEVEKNGIDLAENQATLLKKVEELTLYLIELDKKVATLSKENELLRKK